MKHYAVQWGARALSASAAGAARACGLTRYRMILATAGYPPRKNR